MCVVVLCDGVCMVVVQERDTARDRKAGDTRQVFPPSLIAPLMLATAQQLLPGSCSCKVVRGALKLLHLVLLLTLFDDFVLLLNLQQLEGSSGHVACMQRAQQHRLQSMSGREPRHPAQISTHAHQHTTIALAAERPLIADCYHCL